MPSVDHFVVGARAEANVGWPPIAKTPVLERANGKAKRSRQLGRSYQLGCWLLGL